MYGNVRCFSASSSTFRALADLCQPGGMQAQLVDPRDVRWEVDAPAYRVYFWEPSAGSSGPGWVSEEWEITGTDVGEALAWASRDTKHRQYTLYACCACNGERGLIRLIGRDPTEKA
jgi:hypothetical protein